jgi:hypothetical protein
MNRLTDNDKNFGPFTLARWTKRFSAEISSGDDEDTESHLLFVGFGHALRVRVPDWICPPWRARWVECNWDADTVKRLGRSGYWETHKRQYGFSLSDMGAGYDFFQLFLGPQTHDSRTTKSWSKHLPWKMWNHVRTSIYNPDGSHFATEVKGKWNEFYDIKQTCPTTSFEFEDYDGSKITATCIIEEREWHKGEGWFKWLRHFYPAKICRILDLKFNAEVGPEKGSWKGGTTGHGIEMLAGETPEQAFKRYCEIEHKSRGKKYTLKYLTSL